MSSGGLSAARLGRMHDVMEGYVARGEVPGLVTLVSRHGETHVDVIGAQAIGGSDPMRRDTIFRISSMTKPITAAATMILVEECKLRLDEAVDQLLPELAERRVLTRLDAPLDNTVPAQRSITVRDLLWFFTGGEPHPIFGAESPVAGLSYNDLFRGVHDLFGHAAEGYPFGPRGEENAFLHHSQMFGPLAQLVLTTETRGQNSWFNSGPHADLPVGERPFSEQKGALLPAWCCGCTARR